MSIMTDQDGGVVRTGTRASLASRSLDADERDRLLALRAATSENASTYLAVLAVLAEAKRAYRLQLRTSEIREALDRTPIEGQASSEYDVARAALDQLREWGCVEWVQDPAVRASTIDDYLKRHELWELTAVGASTLEAAESLLRASEESGALQRTMFRQIRSALADLERVIAAKDADGVYLQLQTLDHAIGDLASNAREFYATINRIAREERLDDHVFLVYKDQLIGYLQSFHDDLVRHRTIISNQLVEIDRQHRAEMLVLAEAGDDSVGLFGDRADWSGRWDGMLDWFVAGRGNRTEVDQLGAATTVAIRELLTLLRRLTEQSTRPINRASELRETAAWFARCERDDDAHALFDAAFGLSPTLHVGVDVDDVDAGGAFASWWDVDPADVSITLRRFGRRAASGGIAKRRDYSEGKRLLELQQERDRSIQAAAADHLVTVDLTETPIDPAEWPVLLSWIDQALAARPAATEFSTSVRTPAAIIELASANTDTQLSTPHGVLLIRQCSLKVSAA